MKIKEILELTNDKNIAAIAKENLTIGEKRARAILKDIGATNQSGKKGWFFEGEDPTVLEKSIYDFVSQAKPKATQKPNKKTIHQSTKETKQESIYTESKQSNKKKSNQESKKTKKVTYEIEEWLHDELKIRSIREKRNVSEIVNGMIKKGLE